MSEAQKRTPRPSPEGRDAKSLPLSPTDGFVLSRIDGSLNEADLAASTGLPEAHVQASLAKLESLGLIVFDVSDASGDRALHAPRANGTRTSGVAPAAPPVPPASGASPVVSRTSSVQIRAAAPSAVAPPAVTPPAAKPVAAAPPPPVTGLTSEEQAGLLEEIDLEPELRKRILTMHRDLDRRDYYALLGIEESADRKAVKRAYYELAAAFHPDRYFRKRLGSFKTQMEAVFAKLTLAHDTLSDREKRREYNAYLSEQRISLAIEEDLARGLSQAHEVGEKVERAVSEAIGISPPLMPVPSTGGPASPAAAGAGPAPPIPPPAPPPAPSTPSLSPQASAADVLARREAFARRLLGGSQPRTPSSAGIRAAGPSAPPQPGGPRSPTPATPMAAADAVNALRRRYEERVAGAKASESRKFATQAEAALTAGDLVAAANAFRIAANLTPDDAALAKRAGEAKVKADVLLSDTYTRQALYEETHGQWTEAARSWARVCKVNATDPNAHERAANAVLKSSGDLHEGVRLSLRACELDPKNPLYRITLANCYVAAGLALNARRELDTAAQLAPHDDNIQAMIKRVGPPA